LSEYIACFLSFNGNLWDVCTGKHHRCKKEIKRSSPTENGLPQFRKLKRAVITIDGHRHPCLYRVLRRSTRRLERKEASRAKKSARAGWKEKQGANHDPERKAQTDERERKQGPSLEGKYPSGVNGRPEGDQRGGNEAPA